jgi:hypothetical protein
MGKKTMRWNVRGEAMRQLRASILEGLGDLDSAERIRAGFNTVHSELAEEILHCIRWNENIRVNLTKAGREDEEAIQRRESR